MEPDQKHQVEGGDSRPRLGIALGGTKIEAVALDGEGRERARRRVAPHAAVPSMVLNTGVCPSRSPRSGLSISAPG